MITIKPFKALRPPRDKAYLVASRSYLTYTDTELDDKLRNNPYTFLHVINPEKGRRLKLGPERYKLVKERFEENVNEGIFRRDEQDTYYLYRQVKDGNEYIGLIAAVAVSDYLEGRIKKHEKTITRREKMFADYLEQTGFNAEPVLLSYQDDMRLDSIYAKYIEQRSEYEFTSTDTVWHQLWLINDPEDCQVITNTFKEQGNLYIADGHHRCSSSAMLAERIAGRKDQPEADYHEYFMAFLVGEEHMKIYDFNRLVKNKTSKSSATILKELARSFLIEPKGNQECFKPEKLHEMGMYLEGYWYKLVPKTGSFDPGDAVAHLDAEILSRNILQPIFDIADLKSDKRVSFLPGSEGLPALQKEVDKGKFDLAFSLYPVTMQQIKQVSDQDLTMPPKSTYIEPKLRSGLTVYKILEEET